MRNYATAQKKCISVPSVLPDCTAKWATCSREGVRLVTFLPPDYAAAPSSSNQTHELIILLSAQHMCTATYLIGPYIWHLTANFT